MSESAWGWLVVLMVEPRSEQVLAVRANPLTHAEHERRLTRRQLLSRLGRLKCVDGRAVHPSERMYIDSQQSAQREARS